MSRSDPDIDWPFAPPPAYNLTNHQRIFWGGEGFQDGQQVFCRVHLVPIRGGLLSLPRLEVTTVVGPGEPRDQQEVSGTADRDCQYRRHVTPFN